MSRVRESHGETQAWLTTTDGWTRKVAGAGEGAAARWSRRSSGSAARSSRSAAPWREIESPGARRCDEVHRRLADLGTLSAELKERAEGLRGRMDGAEARFSQLAAQAEEAQRRVRHDRRGRRLRSEEAERRIDAVDESVRGAREPHPAARRAGGADPAPGPGARAAAGRAGQGHRAPHPRLALRQEAAEAAQRLEEVTRRSSAHAEQGGGAGRRARAGWRASWRRGPTRSSRSSGSSPSSRGCSTAVGVGPDRRPPRRWSRRWPGRARSRRSKPRSSTCSTWPSGRSSTSRPSASARRGDRGDPRDAAGDPGPVQGRRRRRCTGFEARKRQLERAEQRLARAEALAMGIRATVESLQAQKTRGGPRDGVGRRA